MKRLTTAARYNRRHYATSKLYAGIDKNGKTASAFACTKAEAKAVLRSRGFVAVRIMQS